MPSESATPPCIRTMCEYSACKKNNSVWWSQPFYSSDRGYKLQLRVAANGEGSGKGTHLTLHAYLMKGDYDDTLSWPLIVTITIQLLNWSSDNCHHKKIIHNYLASLEGVGEGGVRAANGQGYGQFISHAKLLDCSDNRISYIRDNNVCFRITDVTVINFDSV